MQPRKKQTNIHPSLSSLPPSPGESLWDSRRRCAKKRPPVQLVLETWVKLSHEECQVDAQKGLPLSTRQLHGDRGSYVDVSSPALGVRTQTGCSQADTWSIFANRLGSWSQGKCLGGDPKFLLHHHFVWSHSLLLTGLPPSDSDKCQLSPKRKRATFQCFGWSLVCICIRRENDISRDTCSKIFIRLLMVGFSFFFFFKEIFLFQFLSCHIKTAMMNTLELTVNHFSMESLIMLSVSIPLTLGMVRSILIKASSEVGVGWARRWPFVAWKRWAP